MSIFIPTLSKLTIVKIIYHILHHINKSENILTYDTTKER